MNENENEVRRTEPSGDTVRASSPPLGDIVDKLLANPEILRVVASAITSQSQASRTPSAETNTENSPLDVQQESAGTAGQTQDNTQNSAQTSSMADGIADKIPELMATLGPVLSGLQKNRSEPSGAKAQNTPDHRAALLCALKPYLSRERCEAIDYIIKFSRLSDVLKNLM